MHIIGQKGAGDKSVITDLIKRAAGESGHSCDEDTGDIMFDKV